MIRGKCAQLQGENKSLQNTERGTAHNEIYFSRNFDMCVHVLLHVSVRNPLHDYTIFECSWKMVIL